MPKISKSLEYVGKEHYEVEVMYNKDHHFYAKIPSGLEETFDSLYKDWDNREDGCTVDKKIGRIVYDETEHKCLERWRGVVRKLQETAIQRRNVIILYYDGGRNTTYGGRVTNKEHSTLSIGMALVYAVELQVPGKQPRYIREYTIDSWMSEGKVYSEGIHIGNSRGVTIIDDTPENREFMERIYDGIKKLNDALDKYTQTPETLLQLIQSNQKLIG